MGPPKGSKNAKAYHDANTQKRVEQINAVLKSIVNSGLTVTNITALSNYVADQVGTSAVTLRRNPVYRPLLEKHLVTQRGATTILSDRDRQIITLRAKLRTASVEISNLKTDKSRLEKSLLRAEGKDAVPSPDKVHQVEKYSSKPNKDFVATATLVLALLERIDGLEVDDGEEAIIDRAAPPNDQVVAGPNICKPFIKWFKMGGGNGSS